MCLRLTRFHNSGSWYLVKGSNLHHTFHCPIKPEVTKLSDTTLNSEEVDYMKVLYNNEVGVASMGKMLTSLAKRRSVKGLYIAQTVWIWLRDFNLQWMKFLVLTQSGLLLRRQYTPWMSKQLLIVIVFSLLCIVTNVICQSIFSTSDSPTFCIFTSDAPKFCYKRLVVMYLYIVIFWFT